MGGVSTTSKAPVPRDGGLTIPNLKRWDACRGWRPSYDAHDAYDQFCPWRSPS